MFAYSVWINKLFDALRFGCVVGIKEALDDYDHETGQYVPFYVNDRQFRVSGGKVYCKGGSVMYPPPPVGLDEWEIHPIEDPYYFFEDMLDNGCVQEVYLVRCGEDERNAIWNVQTGWLDRKEIVKHAVSSAFSTEYVNEEPVSPVSSLKIVAGLAALDVVGPLSLKEIEYCFDTETRECIMKPSKWWVPL